MPVFIAQKQENSADLQNMLIYISVCTLHSLCICAYVRMHVL